MVADELDSIKERALAYLDKAVAVAVVMAVALAAFVGGRVSILEEKGAQPHSPLAASAAPAAQPKGLGQSAEGEGTKPPSSARHVAGSVPPARAVGKPPGNPANTRNFVASKNGTKYYPAGCSATNRIKEANRVWFATAKEAEAQGYEASARCR